jgi:hypothetical protein
MFTFVRKGKYILMRRMCIQGFLLLVAMLAGGCRPKYSPTPVWIAYNDFENVDGWMDNPTNNSQTIVPGDAYSGRYACMVDRTSNFSYYYKNKLADVSDKKISWVKVSGYCKAKSDVLNKACVVFSVVDEKEINKYWGSAFLYEFTEGKKDKWIHFEKSFDINAVSQPGYTISSFVWSTDTTEKVLIDDFKVEFFK